MRAECFNFSTDIPERVAIKHYLFSPNRTCLRIYIRFLSRKLFPIRIHQPDGVCVFLGQPNLADTRSPTIYIPQIFITCYIVGNTRSCFANQSIGNITLRVLGSRYHFATNKNRSSFANPAIHCNAAPLISEQPLSAPICPR